MLSKEEIQEIGTKEFEKLKKVETREFNQDVLKMVNRFNSKIQIHVEDLKSIQGQQESSDIREFKQDAYNGIHNQLAKLIVNLEKIQDNDKNTMTANNINRITNYINALKNITIVNAESFKIASTIINDLVQFIQTGETKLETIIDTNTTKKDDSTKTTTKTNTTITELEQNSTKKKGTFEWKTEIDKVY